MPAATISQAKARGVTDVAFHKKRGLAVADMTKSAWVYRKLRNFRAGNRKKKLPAALKLAGKPASPFFCCDFK